VLSLGLLEDLKVLVALAHSFVGLVVDNPAAASLEQQDGLGQRLKDLRKVHPEDSGLVRQVQMTGFLHGTNQGRIHL